MWLDAIAAVSDFLKEMWKTAFPDSQETKDRRKEKAKAEWDKYVEEERKARESLYPNDRIPRH